MELKQIFLCSGNEINANKVWLVDSYRCERRNNLFLHYIQPRQCDFKNLSKQKCFVSQYELLEIFFLQNRKRIKFCIGRLSNYALRTTINREFSFFFFLEKAFAKCNANKCRMT